MTKNLLLILFGAVLVVGCTTRPVIDTGNLSPQQQARYGHDLAACRQLASANDPVTGAFVGAATGAAIGAAFGLLASAFGGDVGENVGYGLALGGSGGALAGAGEGFEGHRNIISSCMHDRGYPIIGWGYY